MDTFNLPRGYLKRPSGEVALDPDERVRDTVRLVFDVFERRGSVHGVMRYLVDHGIALPDRARGGPARGEVVWRRPRRGAILTMLTSPTYAGAYVFGRRRPAGRMSGSAAAGRGSRAGVRRTGACCCRTAGPPTSAGAPTRRTRGGWTRTGANTRACRGAAPPPWWGSSTPPPTAAAWSPPSATTRGGGAT